VLENKVLRRIFGPKRDRVTGGWRKLHNEELHNLYSSPSIIRMITSVAEEDEVDRVFNTQYRADESICVIREKPTGTLVGG
jgi:hypothetical protein